MPTLRIVDRDEQDIVYTTDVAATDVIPRQNDHVWVPENGDVAYRVYGVEHDFETNEITVIAQRMEKTRFYE